VGVLREPHQKAFLMREPYQESSLMREPHQEACLLKTTHCPSVQSTLQKNDKVEVYHPTLGLRSGLKMKMRMKRKISDAESPPSCDFTTQPYVKIEQEDLTLNNDTRRHRRRERNKVAATKCRNKKREKTTLLIAEGEVLEVQNVSLKEELDRLNTEKMRLTNMLKNHKSACVKTFEKEISEVKSLPEQNDFDCTFSIHNPPENTSLTTLYPVCTDYGYQLKREEPAENIFNTFQYSDCGNSGDSGFNLNFNQEDEMFAPTYSEYPDDFKFQEKIPRHNVHHEPFFNSFNLSANANFCLDSKVSQLISSVSLPWQFDNECIAL